MIGALELTFGIVEGEYKGSPCTGVELATAPHVPSVFAKSPLFICTQYTWPVA